MTTTAWTPRTEALPWDEARGALVCPACPDHAVDAEAGRYEVCLEAVGLDGNDHHDALSIVRRSPGLLSGPFDVPALPAGMPAMAVVDYLERQTFDGPDARGLAGRLGERFPGSTVHVWAVDDVSDRIAEDAFWDESEQQLVRTPAFDIAPPDYPMDVGWRYQPERVNGSDGASVVLWRGCIYVDVERRGLVRYAWRDFSVRQTAPTDPSGSTSSPS